MRNPQLQNRALGEVLVFPKGADWNVSKNFKATEFEDDFDDPTNHYTLISTKLIDFLQSLRNRTNLPITISSGFRTEKKNTLIGGATNSYHTLGLAADISSKWLQPSVLLYEIKNLNSSLLRILEPGIGGLGYYPSRNFIHIDVRPIVDDKLVYWEEKTDAKQQA